MKIFRLLAISLLVCSSLHAGEKPNIIFILCDDLAQGDLGCYGQKLIQTPNLDRMAAEGTKFPQLYSGTSVCAPSRSSLMTGLHMGHCPIRANRDIQPEGQKPLPAETVTVAQVLKSAGYATACTGKWGMGMFDTSGSPLKKGFDHFYGYNCQRQAHSYYPDHLWDDHQRVDFNGKTYSADLIAVKQLEFLRANANRPFFLYVPTTVPHLALEVPADEPSLTDYAKHFDNEEPYRGGKGYVPCERPLATLKVRVLYGACWRQPEARGSCTRSRLALPSRGLSREGVWDGSPRRSAAPNASEPP